MDQKSKSGGKDNAKQWTAWTEKVRDSQTRVSLRWSLTHLVGQGHKRRWLPGLQWSMKPPGECNRRALKPPYSLLTNQPADSLQGSTDDKGHRLLGPALIPGARMPTKEIEISQLSLEFAPAFNLYTWDSCPTRRREENRGTGICSQTQHSYHFG